jgi:hypothetical protein
MLNAFEAMKENLEHLILHRRPGEGRDPILGFRLSDSAQQASTLKGR